MGLLPLLFGCGKKDSPFQQRNGVWYYHETPIENADPASFEVLSPHYAKDRQRVYHGDTYRDGRDYFEGAVLTRAVSSFRVLSFGYAKTATEVYYMGKRIPGADAISFATLDQPTDTADARDREHAYQQGRRAKGGASAQP